jgi:hypothetical protein
MRSCVRYHYVFAPPMTGVTLRHAKYGYTYLESLSQGWPLLAEQIILNSADAPGSPGSACVDRIANLRHRAVVSPVLLPAEF